MACAPSEDSDQPGHPPSLIIVLLCVHWVAKYPSFLRADSEYSDQTGRMLRLIRVFAGRTCHFVGFVMRWLSYMFVCLSICLNVLLMSTNASSEYLQLFCGEIRNKINMLVIKCLSKPMAKRYIFYIDFILECIPKWLRNFLFACRDTLY